MKLAIVGTGYVGLVTGTCFAELGNQVVCMDIDAKKVEMMGAGKSPIYEPGLQELLTRNMHASHLQFTTDLQQAVEDAEIIFLALPTPPGEDGSADLSYILAVADQLGPLLKHYSVVVDKSTVPVGTAEDVRRRIAATATAEFDVISNPEFLREGFAVQDCMRPNRVVIGTNSERARAVMQKLYTPLVDDARPLLFMNQRSAELTKYAANSFLATKITFMNQIANLCEELGADVDAVRQGVGSDDRIGSRFLYPGIGYGGSCFPKDVLALMHTAADHGYEFGLLRTVIENNKAQQQVLADKMLRYYGGSIAGKRFCLWGLAFKPDTDDIREAPSLTIIDVLTKAGASVTAYDPEATDNARRLLSKNKHVSFADEPFAALADADALVIATEWDVFARASLARIKRALKIPVVFDGRNIFALHAMRKAGFYYESIGRSIVQPSGL